MNGVVARTAFLGGAFFSALGCGGSSTHPGDDDAGSGGSLTSGGSGGSGHGGTGGTSTSGGTGGIGAGGTGGVSTPPAAGLSINLSDPSAAEVPNLGSRSCPAGETGAFTYTIGKPAPNGTLADGTGETRVACVVTASGAVAASVSGLDGNIKVRVAFDVQSTVTDKLGTSPAKLTFYTPTTQSLEVVNGFPDCTLGPITTLKAGAILADFKCPLLGTVADTSTGCKAAGTLAFEYCATEE